MPKRTAVFPRRLLVPALALGIGMLGFAAVPGSAGAQSASDGAASVGVDAAIAARDATLKRNSAQAVATPAPSQPAGGSPAIAKPASSGDTPPPEITESDVSKPGFEGAPLTYSIDLSAMVSGGATDNDFANDPGGLDASLLYKIGRTTRLNAAYFQFSATPLGNDDELPVVFQGTKTPIAYVNGDAAGINGQTHLRFQLYDIQQLFTVGGRHHPLVIAPTYAFIRSSIGDADDSGPIYANGTFMTVHQRSYQNKGLNLVIPLFYAEKYLISYSGGAIWNMNTNGANLTNHVQYLQSAFAQYQPSQDITAFVNFVNSVTYFPTDSYPYHSPTFHYGISKYFKRPFWIEGEVSTGGPSDPNYGGLNNRIGIPYLTVPCASTARGGGPTLPCVANATNDVLAPFVGAQRFTTFTLMIGIGANPLVRPF